MIYNNILEAMGHTPMVRLNKLAAPDSAEILVKVEALNVGGSIKSRTALNMIEEAEKAGLLSPDSVIVEPTSGNQGIGLALVGAIKGYRTIIVMPDSVSLERRKLVHHYGAEVCLVHDDGDIGKCIEECLQTALRMQEADPKVFIPQQFSNPDNKYAHIRYTAQEILDQANGPIHGFCSGIGTGGTISGIGDGIIPEILNQQIYSDICVISDEEALETAKRLAKEEGLMVGISSGTNVAAALRLAKKLGKGKTVVTVLPDTAERYFSTPLFEGE